MIKKVEGIVISEVPYGDTSKIINVFTREYGIIGLIAKGAKSVKSKLRVYTSRFTYGYFHIYYKENKLCNLITCDIINELSKIKKDIKLISHLTYITELTTQVAKQNDDEELFDLYINTILKLESGLNPIVLTNIIEIKLLDYLGVNLNLDSCVKCGDKINIVTIDGDFGGFICKKCLTNEFIVDSKTIKMLRMYYYVDVKSITELKISEKVVNEINYFLDKYYERYTGLYLYSKTFLKQVS